MTDRKRGGEKDDKPLVQSTVELYQDGEEAMHRPPSPEAAAVGALGRLVELQNAAVAATRAAIDRVQDAGARQRLQAQLSEQSEIANAAGQLVSQLGGSPPTAAESRASLPSGADAIAYAAGDAAVLRALGADYAHVAQAYSQAAAELPASVRGAVQELAKRQQSAARAVEKN